MTRKSQRESDSVTRDRPLAAPEDNATPAQRRTLLRERAQRLAKEPPAEEDGERLEVVEFLLGAERYAVEASFVREVHPLREVTHLPCTPPFVLGIMNLRGEVLSVLDLRSFFDLGEGTAELSKVIVLRCATMEFGILADAVIGVRTILARGVQPSLATVAGIGADYLKGVTRDHLVLLDAGKMLNDKRLVVHEEV